VRNNVSTAWWLGAAAAALTVGVCMPATALEGIPGKFSVQLGVSSVQESNVLTGQSTGSQTTFAWGVDYRYPLGNRFGVGASLLNWKFDPINRGEGTHGGTSLCLTASYLMGAKSNSEIFLGAGSDLVRIGYRLYAGKNDVAERGMYYGVEFDTPTQDSTVNSFGGVAVGYSF